jgi:hypothetical protein
MKTLILIIFLSALFFTAGIKSQLLVGPLAGVSNNSLAGDSPEDVVYQSRWGFTFGLNGELMLGGGINLFIQPRYQQRGIKLAYDIGEDDPVDSVITDLNYFSMPVGLKIYAGNRVVFFTGGLDFAYLLNAHNRFINPPEDEKDISSILKKGDMGLFLGFGVNFKLGLPQLNLELRVTSGVTNAYKENGENTFSIPARLRLKSFQLMAAFNFPFFEKKERRVSK